MFYNEKPLADLLRPSELSEMVGIESILNKNSIIKKMIDDDNLSSFVIWGPPGVGKTTIATIISSKTKMRFIPFSAVLSSITDVKKVMFESSDHYRMFKQKTVVFIDEIHRFNKSQQDAFLPFVENGTIILIGATTENPSFSIISPLLSRLRVMTLNQLSQDDTILLLKNTISKIKSRWDYEITINDEEIDTITEMSGGDARKALGIVELLLKKNGCENKCIVNSDDLVDLLFKTTGIYDKNGDNHYDYISALHKSMRNSDIDAALFYCLKMLRSGDDPNFIVRRVIQFSSEDVGLADPEALNISISAKNALDHMGMPEATLPILQAVAYNTLAPKSNSLYIAMQMIDIDIQNYNGVQIPLQIRNAPTKLMKELGYGKGYAYAHDSEIPVTDMVCLPDILKDRVYYKPKNYGFEKKMSERLSKIDVIKGKATSRK